MIKVEPEEDEPEGGTKITLAMIAKVILTLVTQLLFTKCKKRYTKEETVKPEVEEIPEEASEDEFEIISNHEEEQEAMIPNQERQQEEAAEGEMPAEAAREEPPLPPQEIEAE